jgi:membrane protein YqaA with SNARE-associated domain
MTESLDEPALVEPALVPRGKRRSLFWRADFAVLAFSILLVTVFALAFFYFDINLAQLQTYGYLGVFLISLLGSASLFLPTPSIAVVFGGGAVLQPILGIPAPIIVGVVSGLAQTLGEFTGYAAGYGGSAVIRDRPFYRTLQEWMHKNGSVIMFLFAAIPNPVIDAAGIIAGAVRMPAWKYFVAVFLGKTLRNTILALAGLGGLTLIEHIFA